MKHNFILGVSESHNASAALLKDGELVAAAQEERFTREKNASGYPKNAIDYCLKYARIKASDLELVVIADKVVPPIFDKSPENAHLERNFFLDKFLDLETALELKFPFIRDLSFKLYRSFNNLNRIDSRPARIKKLKKYFRLNEDKFVFVDHHLCHGLAALYSSGLAQIGGEILIFTADGVGDNLSATLSIFDKNGVKKLYSNPSQNSLGFFYQHITEFLGFKPIEDEYKVMGLASYVPDSKSEKVYKKIKEFVDFDKKDLIWKFKVNELLFKKMLPNILKGFRFDAIASGAQRILEDSLLFWIENNIKKYSTDNIVCGGGVIANIKANQKIANLKPLRNAFFMFSPGDESNSIGAAYQGYLNLTKAYLPEIKLVNNLYLGPGFSDSEIEREIKRAKLKFKTSKPKNLEKEVAKLLAKGEVVARFSGRMEFGSRALGNRSILANPSKLEVVFFINSAIKNRDFWMPFAPTILKEKAREYLIPHKASSPFMTVSFDTTEKARKDLAATIHSFDKTTRPQILERQTNPDYYQLIKEFEKITGIGALLNTSFNLHGEPIVCTPQDAIRVFQISGLKYLNIGPFLISK